jgi:enamine deaminase RidA (YjgF/YER057c/UK114 family)
MDMHIYNPDTLGKPLGQYCHVTRVKAAEFLFLAGMLSTDQDGNVVGEGDFDAQCTGVFANIEAVAQVGGNRLRKRGAVYNLSRACPRHSELHDIPLA